MSKAKKSESGNITGRKVLFNIILFAVLFVVVIALFHTFVFSDKMLYGSDTIQAGIFFRSFYVNYVHQHGSVPIWNPYQFAGIPYIDGFHGDIFYPFSVLKFFGNIFRMLGWNLLLHIFFGGITMFFCARVFGRSQIASALAAVSYMFAAYFLSQVAPGHDGKMYVTALFPLTLMFIELAFRSRPLLNFGLLGLTIGIIIVTPHVQMAYYSLWACAFYMVFKLITTWLDTRSIPKVVTPTALFAVAIIVGLAVSAIQFYPGYTYVKKYSPRSEEKRGMDWARSWSLHWEEAASLVVPNFCGVSDESGNSYWGRNPFKDNSEYAGAVPLLLALVAIIMIRSRKTWFFGGLAVFALIYGLSGQTPFFYLFYYLIPNVKSTRAWSMIMFLFSFSIALLAAFGLDFIIERGRHIKEQHKRTFMIAVFGLPGLVFLGALFFAASPDAAIGLYKAFFYSGITPDKNAVLARHLGGITGGFWITFFFLAATAAVLWLYGRRKLGVLAMWIVVALALIDAFRFDLRFIRTFDQKQAFAPTSLVEFFKSVSGQFRVLDTTGGYLRPNYLPYFGIEEMTGFHGNELRWYYNLIGGMTQDNLLRINLLNMTNTKYFMVSPASPLRGDKLAEAGFPKVAQWQQIQVYENPLANDRAWIVHEWIVDSDETNLDKTILDRNTFDPKLQVGMFEDPGVRPTTDSALIATDSVAIVRYENNYVMIKTQSEADGVLVLADNWYPAWKGFIDDKEVTVHRVNGAFQGIVLPAGNHTVEFRYISEMDWMGRVLTLAGLLAAALMIVAGAVFGRRNGTQETMQENG